MNIVFIDPYFFDVLKRLHQSIKREKESTLKNKNMAEQQKKRVFKIVTLNGKVLVRNGSYGGKVPSQAAKKAFNSLFRKTQNHEPVLKASDTKSHTLVLRETGNKTKVFTYTVKREKLETPQVVKRGDKNYDIKFTTTVKALSGKDVPVATEVKKPAAAASAKKGKGKGKKAGNMDEESVQVESVAIEVVEDPVSVSEAVSEESAVVESASMKKAPLKKTVAKPKKK